MLNKAYPQKKKLNVNTKKLLVISCIRTMQFFSAQISMLLSIINDVTILIKNIIIFNAASLTALKLLKKKYKHNKVKMVYMCFPSS